jgi:quercetin dioxygenase-like cupin family protein
LVALIVLTVTACGHAPPQAAPDASADKAVPVYQEPRHRLVFESPLVRVLDVRLPPGDTTEYHVHDARLVGIAVQGARIWSQVPGAPPGPIATPEATPYVFENWSASLPYTHRVTNVDTLPLHYVVAEWRARSGSEVAALPDVPGRRLIKEGPTARVYEITLAPGAATEAHTHAAPGLTVLGTPGVLSEDGSPRARGGTGPGTWSWREAPHRHVLRNDGPTRMIVYEIDWR